MHREDASDLLAFLAVASERNFTRAAAKLGMTQSALSQIIRNLEERLGVRLLNRTTRSVTPTQAGEQLFLSIGPKFTEMDADLAALSELREKPAGTVRLTATEYAASEILLPALGKVLRKYPDIHVEIISPDQTVRDSREKLEHATAHGCPLGWLIHPEKKMVDVYRPGLPAEPTTPSPLDWQRGPNKDTAASSSCRRQVRSKTSLA